MLRMTAGPINIRENHPSHVRPQSYAEQAAKLGSVRAGCHAKGSTRRIPVAWCVEISYLESGQ